MYVHTTGSETGSNLWLSLWGMSILWVHALYNEALRAGRVLFNFPIFVYLYFPACLEAICLFIMHIYVFVTFTRTWCLKLPFQSYLSVVYNVCLSRLGYSGCQCMHVGQACFHNHWEWVVWGVPSTRC